MSASYYGWRANVFAVLVHSRLKNAGVISRQPLALLIRLARNSITAGSGLRATLARKAA
jgi:hypothetical protein